MDDAHWVVVLLCRYLGPEVRMDTGAGKLETCSWREGGMESKNLWLSVGCLTRNACREPIFSCVSHDKGTEDRAGGPTIIINVIIVYQQGRRMGTV